MDEDTSSTKMNWKSFSQLNDEEKDQIRKTMAAVNSVLQQSEDKKEEDRKNRIIVFYYRKGIKPPVSEPTNEQEVPECSSTTSDAQAILEEDP